MINLIPMAGEGSRFKKEGYEIPKPLIKVSGKPMIVQASNSLPKTDKWIYMCRKEHIELFSVDKVLKSYFEQSIVLEVDALTEGQACTCLLAKEYIDREEELLIGACDNGMIWDKEKFNTLRSLDVDCIVWTFRNNGTVVDKPEGYGWAKVNTDGNVDLVSVKVPISNSPIKDHAIVGTFWFRSGSIFVKAAEKMIRKNRRINGEFYVDECINELIEIGHNVKVFEVDKYICWGTPNDLKTFEYWQGFFNQSDFHPYFLERDDYYGK